MSIDARTDWENRIGTRSGAWEGDFRGDAPELDPPADLVADAGAAQVTLSWEPVAGAIGYQVHVSGAADGIFEPLDHHGRDVLLGAAPAVRRHDRHARDRAVVRRLVAVRRPRRRSDVGPRRGDPVDGRRRRGHGVGRCGLGPRGAAAPVAADDRQRAPVAHAVDRRDRWPGGRGGAHVGPEGGARRARRHPRPRARDPLRRPRGLPRGGRRAGARLHRRGPGLRPPALDRDVPRRRAVLHAARPRVATRR